MGKKEEDLIKYLDAFMSGNGGSVKPMVDENGDISFVTIRESDEAQAANEELKNAELAFGERMNREGNLFSDGEDDNCPTCASIPNLDGFDDEW